MDYEKKSLTKPHRDSKSSASTSTGSESVFTPGQDSANLSGPINETTALTGVTEVQPTGKICASTVKEMICRCLPILVWLPKYKPVHIVGDMIAGLTVGFTAVPQVMAYAVMAGLKPQYGLYSSFVAPLIYIVLGSCYQVTIGPTAIISLVAFEACGENYPECVILSSFWAGIFALLLALFRLGAVVSLIAEPVTIGFTAGAAITVSSSQIKSLLGLSGTAGKNQNNFIGYWKFFVTNISSISLGDSILGLTCLIVLVLFQKLNKVIQIAGTDRRSQIGRRCLWVLSISRNVLVVSVTTLIAFIWSTVSHHGPPFKLIGPVPGGFPPVRLPSFLLPINDHQNNSEFMQEEEIQETLSFSETWALLGTAPLIIALIAILQNVAIAKVYGNGQKIDGTQEMFALGVCNVVGSFFSAQPVSGSFSRSAINEASGVRTPLSGLFTSLIIVLSLGVLTPGFTYIPKASLAAIIICALLVLIEYDTFIPMWKVSKFDVLTCFLTFISSLLLGMEYGIGVGTACSIAILLYKSLSSQLISELKVDPKTKLNYILLKPMSGPLQFPMIDVLRHHINSHILDFKTTHHIIVLDCLHWTYFDYTGISAIGSIIKSLQKHNKFLVLLNCSNSRAWAVGLNSVGISNYNLFCNSLDDFDSHETDLSQVFHTSLLPLLGSSINYNPDERYQGSDQSI